MWWEWHGGSGASKEAGMKITAQLAGCGSTERHWKGFKDILTKKRNRLGHAKVGMLMEIKCDINRELQDLKCADRPKKYVSDRELIALDLGFTWDSLNADGALPKTSVREDPGNLTLSAVFLNWMETWENAAMMDKGKNSTGRYKVLRKYKGILFHDDDLHEDREVVDLEWSLKRWVLVSQLSTLTNDEDSIGPETLESYVINGTLYKMIAASTLNSKRIESLGSSE